MVTFMKKNILIVDDERLILMSLVAALKAGSLEIETAASGARALEAVRSSPDFDLCLVDLTLPDMAGIELIQKIKEISTQSKFIIMSGKYSSLQDLLSNCPEAVAIGPSQFIPKPFDFDQVQDIVFEVLLEE